MKIVIAGSRLTVEGYDDIISEILDKYNPETDTIIHGGASGVDSMAGKLALARKFKVIKMKAEWRKNRENGKYKPEAGPIRNQKMIDSNPDIVYLLPYPSLKESTGTYDTYKRATQKGIKTVVLLRSEKQVEKKFNEDCKMLDKFIAQQKETLAFKEAN